MIIAAIGDTPYRIVLLLHILTALVAFAPVFTHPFLSQQAKALDAASERSIRTSMLANGRKMYAPALILTGLLGFALSGMSDSVLKLSQGWLVASFLLWVAMNGVLHAIILPTEKKMAEGDMSAESKLNAAGAAISLMLVIMLYLMIFKPGL